MFELAEIRQLLSDIFVGLSTRIAFSHGHVHCNLDTVREWRTSKNTGQVAECESLCIQFSGYRAASAEELLGPVRNMWDRVFPGPSSVFL